MSEASTLGDFIRERRTSKKMTLRALARSIGVSAPFLSDVEHNRRSLSDDTIAKLAKALGCRKSALVKHVGLRRDLIEWIRSNPELEALLRDMKESSAEPVANRCPYCPYRGSASPEGKGET